MRTQRNVHFFYPVTERFQSSGETGGTWPSFCARFGPDRLVQEAVQMVTSPSHWLRQHTFIALCPSSSLECISWRVGPTCLANTCHYQHTHTHTLSLSLSLSVFLCVCSGVCVHTSASETESLVGMNSCRFEFILFWFRFFFFSGSSPIFSQFDFCGYCC